MIRRFFQKLNPFARKPKRKKRATEPERPSYWFAPPVELAFNQPIVLMGLEKQRGQEPSNRSRVLVNGQVDPTQNGVYLATGGDWRRTTDFTHAIRPISIYVQSGRFKGYVALLEGEGKVEIGLEAIKFKIVEVAQ